MANTQVIDQLYLELSQFSNARTARELELEAQLNERDVELSLARAYANALRHAGTLPPEIVEELYRDFDALPWAYRTPESAAE